MEQRISLITLGVADMDVAAAFYDGLGWQRVDSPDGVIAYDLIAQTLGLYPKSKLAEDLGIAPDKVGGFSGVTLGHNLPTKAAVDALAEQAESAGGKVLKPPHDIFWGGYSAFVADPDGHVWELAHNPFSPLGPKGEFRWNGFG